MKKTFLAVLVAFSATASFAGVGIDSIEVGASTLHDGYELHIARKLPGEAGMGLVAGLVGSERKYLGAHYQAPTLTPIENVGIRFGTGLVHTSTDWTSTARTPVVATGTESRWTPFLSFEVNYQIKSDIEAFAQTKWFSNFASIGGSEDRTFGGVGLRVRF